jgi:hypothetical protein
MVGDQGNVDMNATGTHIDEVEVAPVIGSLRIHTYGFVGWLLSDCRRRANQQKDEQG